MFLIWGKLHPKEGRQKKRKLHKIPLRVLYQLSVQWGRFLKGTRIGRSKTVLVGCDFMALLLPLFIPCFPISAWPKGGRLCCNGELLFTIKYIFIGAGIWIQISVPPSEFPTSKLKNGAYMIWFSESLCSAQKKKTTSKERTECPILE